MAKLFLIYILGTCLHLSSHQLIGQAIEGKSGPTDNKATKETCL
jgi:hypothetical protein